MNWCNYLVGVDSVDPKSSSAPSLDDVRRGKATIRQGQLGESVKYAQALAGAVATGTFDDKTLAAVKAFQQKNKITPSGEVDKATMAALDRLAGGPAPSMAVIDMSDEDDPKTTSARLPPPASKSPSASPASSALTSEGRPWWHYALGGVAAIGAGAVAYKVAS